MVNRNHVYVGHMFGDGRWDSMQSEDIIYTTYNNAGMRIFNIKDQFTPRKSPPGCRPSRKTRRPAPQHPPQRKKPTFMCPRKA
jgi:hypothetical protein